MRNFTHLHVAGESRDCDGGHGYTDILWPYRWGERMIDADALWSRMVESLLGWNIIYPGGSVKNRGGELFFSAPTDEGFTSKWAYRCGDDCEGSPATEWDQ